MKLHGNAALTLKKRRLLVSRVVEHDWSLAAAAEAADVSKRVPTSGLLASGSRVSRDWSTAPRLPSMSTTARPRIASR